jgi:hypothetical protein
VRGQAEQLRCVNRSEILRHLNRSYENATSSLYAPEFASSCRCSANRRPRGIPELTVIVGECRLPGSRDSGRRRLTRFPNVARGLTFHATAPERTLAASIASTDQRPNPPSASFAIAFSRACGFCNSSKGTKVAKRRISHLRRRPLLPEKRLNDDGSCRPGQSRWPKRD